MKQEYLVKKHNESLRGNIMTRSRTRAKSRVKNVFGLLLGIGAIGALLNSAFTSNPSPQTANNTQTPKKQEREARIAAANQKSQCEKALASYDPQRWHYTQSPDGPQSKWRSVDCATYSCSGYTGAKKDRVLQRSFGRVYNFLKTDEPNNSCSTNVHQFTCKFDRPKIDPLFLNRDINQVLKNIGVPEISGQLKTGLSLDRSRTYEYYYNDGHNIYVHVEDSWNKDCSYVTSITYSHYEYKE
jgi:hypothetical protein